MTRVLAAPATFMFLAFVYPTVFLLGQNGHLYQPVQVAGTIVLMALIAGGAAGLAWVAARAGRRLPRLTDAALTAAGAAVLLTLLYSPIGAVVRDRTMLVGVYVGLTIGAGALGATVGPGVLTRVLCLLVALNVGLTVVHAFEETAPAAGDAAGAVRRDITFARTPNVYLVILESYNGLDVRRDVYGLDNAPLTSALAAAGYTVYDEVYANYWSTVFSVSSMFSMSQHHYEHSVDIADGGTHRKIIGGVLDNPVLETLSRNGYVLDFSRFLPSVYHPGALLDRYAPQAVLQPLELFPGVFSVAYRVFNVELWTDPAFQSFLFLPNRLFADGGGAARPADAGRPVFSLLYAGAEHTDKAVAVDREWIDRYRALVVKADRVLIDLVHRIEMTDPGAIVVLLGDHGAWRTRDQWMGESANPNVNLRARGVSPVEATKDLFGVFLAVKWPRQAEVPPRVSPVNLFRDVFAVLTDDPRIRNSRAADDSFAYVFLSEALTETPRVYRTVKDGTPLADWEPWP